MLRTSGLNEAELKYIDTLSGIVRRALPEALGMEVSPTETARERLTSLHDTLLLFEGVCETREASWGRYADETPATNPVDFAADILTKHSKEVMDLIQIEIYIARFRSKAAMVVTDVANSVPWLANETMRSMIVHFSGMIDALDSDGRNRLSRTCRKLETAIKEVPLP
jgi:hypothetical protein